MRVKRNTARYGGYYAIGVSPLAPTGIERLREIVRKRVKAEGLRPLATRLDVSLGQIRSLVGTRAVLSTTLEEVASKLGFTIMIHRVGEAPPDDDTPPWAQAIRDDIAKLRDDLSRDYNI